MIHFCCSPPAPGSAHWRRARHHCARAPARRRGPGPRGGSPPWSRPQCCCPCSRRLGRPAAGSSRRTGPAPASPASRPSAAACFLRLTGLHSRAQEVAGRHGCVVHGVISWDLVDEYPLSLVLDQTGADLSGLGGGSGKLLWEECAVAGPIAEASLDAAALQTIGVREAH